MNSAGSCFHSQETSGRQNRLPPILGILTPQSFELLKSYQSIMDRRTYEGPMDWEYQDSGPFDPTSPFTHAAKSNSQNGK